MTTWIEFFTQHYYLWIAAFLILGLLLLLEFETVFLGIRTFNANDLVMQMNRGATVIDINEASDFMLGHILGSTHIPFSHWPEKISHLDKTKLTIVVSNQDKQILQAAKMLRQQGFQEVGILSGGLTAWKRENFPLTKK